MESPNSILDSVLNNYVEHLKELRESLVCCIQFGSTVRGSLKRETDIDLFLVFKTLPESRIQRSIIVEEIESKCYAELKKSLPSDYNICFSSILRTLDESSKFSVLYLDMVDHSKIIYDPDGYASSLIAKAGQWIKDSGAYRVEKGLKWYWVFKDITWDNEQKIGW